MNDLSLTSRKKILKYFSFLYVVAVLLFWYVLSLISATLDSYSYGSDYSWIKSLPMTRISLFLLSFLGTVFFFAFVIFLNVFIFKSSIRMDNPNPYFRYFLLMAFQTLGYVIIFSFLILGLINPWLGFVNFVR